VGITRVGKSTLYNYLTGKKLVPKYEGEYTYESTYKRAVETKGGFSSVTLIANISESYRLNQARH
jgi:ribosome biogenesis GTPase A